jgi:hypothetical protein
VAKKYGARVVERGDVGGMVVGLVLQGAEPDNALLLS